MSQNINRDIKAWLPEIGFSVLNILFLLICWRYSSLIPIWGDEAFSLKFVSSSWDQLYNVFDTHFPTYLFYLKGLISCFGTENETLLRFFYVFPFVIGLFFGYCILRLLNLSSFVSMLALTSAIFLPLYSFYATNLRMYSLLYAASMFFFYRTVNLVIHYERSVLKDWIWFLLASVILLLMDFPGMYIYGVGASAVMFKLFARRNWLKIFYLPMPLFALLVVFGPHIFQSIDIVLNWSSQSGTIPDLNYISVLGVLKFFFKAFRPSLELVSNAQDNLYLAIVFPALLTAMLLVTLICFIFNIKRQNARSWVIMILSFYWMPLVPLGYSGVTRVFLPCLFFMPVFLIVKIPKLPRLIHIANITVFAFLIFINIYQTLYPTLRFYSAIPFQTIARNSIQFAEKENIDNIYISGNTFNSLAIEHYLKKEFYPEVPSVSIKIIPTNYDRQKLKLGMNKSVFISHLPENGAFIYYKELFPDDQYLAENINNYLRLDALPYNKLWRKQIMSRGGQSYAVMVYYVKKK